jgi:hypothetical protein
VPPHQTPSWQCQPPSPPPSLPPSPPPSLPHLLLRQPCLREGLRDKAAQPFQPPRSALLLDLAEQEVKGRGRKEKQGEGVRRAQGKSVRIRWC